VYDRVFVPWAKAARGLPGLAEWLTRRHTSRAIDDYSIQTTEQDSDSAANRLVRPRTTRC
jgi:hypothetical protein